jgi:hypothetical protein
MREGYEPLAGRRRAVVVVFFALIAVNTVAVWFPFLDLDLLDRIESGALVGDDEIDANDTRIGAIGIVQTLVYVACAIVFIRWLRAAYRDADVLAPGVRRYGHGWAIGAWFVPFLNLWRPKQIVNDVWKAGAMPGDGRRPPVLLLAWWLYGSRARCSVAPPSAQRWTRRRSTNFAQPTSGGSCPTAGTRSTR